MENNVKGRRSELDILKGIGILLMVFDHVGWAGYVHTYVQSFHMPLFFIVSGFLWKTNDISIVLRKRWRTLMIPYCMFASGYLLLSIFMVVIGCFQKSILNMLRAICVYPTDMGNMPFAPALWFLPCMFLTEILYTMISNIKGTMVKKGIIVGIIALIGMVYSNSDMPMLPFALEPVATAVFFWYVGELIHINYAKISKVLNRNSTVFVLMVVSVLCAFLNGCVDMRSARYCIAPLYLLNGILGTSAYWSMAMRLDKINVLAFTKAIQYFSINAMAYLCMNQFFIWIGNSVLENVLCGNLFMTILQKI